jgi:predicted DNA-binding transcriptional regulator YafY
MYLHSSNIFLFFEKKLPMPINRNALIRYRTIDKCLQNRRRKWTIEDLIDACTGALYEYEGIDKGVSLRTIRLDLNAMRSDKLGYNAPIVVSDKKYYSYEDPDYSISKTPLSSQDLNVLQEVSHLLRQFKGFSHFQEVTEMVNRLEDKIYSEKNQQVSVIDFEKNELLAGIEWLDILYKSIIDSTTLRLTYQSFKAREASDLILYPYLLKEYRNRWFILGMVKSSKEIITLALDRIQQVTPLPEELFHQSPKFDPHTWFKDIIGVTRNIADHPTTIEFLADHNQAPYIRTKPLHLSQQIIEKRKDGVLFSISVIPNFELDREFIGFGEGLKIISPSSYVRRIRRKVRLMHHLYEDPS